MMYDAKYGLPSSKHPPLSLTASHVRTIGERVMAVNETATQATPVPQYVPFIEAARLSTADPGKRRLRHEFLWDQVLKGL